VQLWDKAVRDELCKRLKLSSARPRKLMWVTAQLTLHQRSMHDLVRRAFEGDEYTTSMASDVVEIWRRGRQGAYRIATEHSRTKVDVLVERAKAVLESHPSLPEQPAR
jgi:hypothetical protein